MVTSLWGRLRRNLTACHACAEARGAARAEATAAEGALEQWAALCTERRRISRQLRGAAPGATARAADGGEGGDTGGVMALVLVGVRLGQRAGAMVRARGSSMARRVGELSALGAPKRLRAFCDRVCRRNNCAVSYLCFVDQVEHRFEFYSLPLYILTCVCFLEGGSAAGSCWVDSAATVDRVKDGSSNTT
jgi:hypothetical protein